MKKLLCALLCVMMVFCMMPTMAFAEEMTAAVDVSDNDGFKAALTADTAEIVINLKKNVSYDINAWEQCAMGGASTTTITINGNGHTITFNKLNSDWNHVTTMNDAKLIINNAVLADSGHNDGPWNRYDINFACDVELNQVTSNKALAFKADATLNDVTVSDSNDVYAIWIQPNGQTVEIDELTVNAGRGIKIDEQYVDSPATVTLTVDHATFDTVKKSAILVKSKAGANIVLGENVDISGVAADSTFAVWVDEDSAEHANAVDVTGGKKAVEGAIVKVATKADLDAAIANAEAGATIILSNDIDYGANQLKIEKAITLDLGGHTLTNSFGYGGLSLKNNCSVMNGSIDHQGGVAAIKAWNVNSLEDLTVTVAERPGKTVGGIVIQEGTEVRINTIKNVTINGAGLTNGIETYNCGNATEPVIGSMENVSIDAKGTGMLISAPCGTATNCDINGDVSGIEIWIKGTYSATLNLVDCNVTGGEQAVYAHDEFSSNPDIVNIGKIVLTADDDTDFTSTNGSLLKLIIARIDVDEQVKMPEILMNTLKAKVAAQDFNLWGPEYPGWYNVGWAYEPGFDTDTITKIKVGITDGIGNAILTYVADEKQLEYQRANGYIGMQSSAPFYKEYNGEEILEGDQTDWIVEKGPAFGAFAAEKAFVEVTTIGGTARVEYICSHTHNWDSEFTVDKEATLSAAGEKSKHCTLTDSGCIARTEITVIPKLTPPAPPVGGGGYIPIPTPTPTPTPEQGGEVVTPDEEDALSVNVKALLDELTLVARSEKTAAKNVKVTLKLDEADQAIIKQLEDAGYTVKYNFYRSTIKNAKYKSMLIKDTTTYTNTYGEKNTMYYYKARIQVYNAEGELIARTELKDCWYANRLWTK